MISTGKGGPRKRFYWQKGQMWQCSYLPHKIKPWICIVLFYTHNISQLPRHRNMSAEKYLETLSIFEVLKAVSVNILGCDAM
jgi:hypothetical protein